MQVSEACTAFLKCCAIERQLSPHTLAAYEQDLLEFSRKHRRLEVSAIASGHLVDYVVGLRDRGLAPATVKRRLACARGMFKWLKGRSHIAVNPFHDLDLRIRLPERLPRCLDAGEMGRLTRAARRASLPTRLATFLLFVTGIRVSELARLTVGDIDLVLGAIRINGKGNRQRMVFVTDHYTADLLVLRLTEAKNAPLSEPLLRNNRRWPLTAPAIRARIKCLARTADIGRVVTPHMLRHTTATCLLEAGVDIRFVQRLLGHQSITTTQIYTHVRDETLRKVLRAADIVSHLSRQAC